MRLIDADDFGNRMYHEAFEKDSDLQKWDSGCWIRYKLFENVLREQPTVQPDHIAESGKKVEQTGETAQNVQNEDLISRKWLVECIEEGWVKFDTAKDCNRMMHLVRDIAPSVQPEQNAQDEDLVFREAAIEALARMMPRSYTPDGSHPADEEIFRAQEVFADCIEALEILPSAAPSTAHTTETTAETTAPSTDDWIPVERELPEDLAEVNVTWVNHEPEPYYEPIKSKPFTASAVYYEGNWYWYSSVCADVLAEYGRNDVDKVDDTIEITAWKPLPEPYQGGEK